MRDKWKTIRIQWRRTEEGKRCWLYPENVIENIKKNARGKIW